MIVNFRKQPVNNQILKSGVVKTLDYHWKNKTFKLMNQNWLGLQVNRTNLKWES